MSDEITEWRHGNEEPPEILCNASEGIMYGCIFGVILWALILAAIAAVVLL